MRLLFSSKTSFCWLVALSIGTLCTRPAASQVNSTKSKQNEPPQVLKGTFVAASRLKGGLTGRHSAGRAGIVVEVNGKNLTIPLHAQTIVEVRWKDNSNKLATGQWVEVSGTLAEGGGLTGRHSAGHLRDGSLTVVNKSKRPVRPTIVSFPYSPDTDLKLSFLATVIRLEPLTVRPMEQLALMSDAQKVPVGNTGATRVVPKYDKLLPFTQYTVQLVDPTTVNVMSHDLRHALAGARTAIHLDKRTRRIPVRVVVINPDLPDAPDQQVDDDKQPEKGKKIRRRGRQNAGPSGRRRRKNEP